MNKDDAASRSNVDRSDGGEITTVASTSTLPQYITTNLSGNLGGSFKRPSRKRQYTIAPKLAHLESMLDMKVFIDHMEKLIDCPIKIPSTLTATDGRGRNKQVPGKAKRDLLSVENIWENASERKSEISILYNTETVGERKWLLDLLLEESESDSDGEEEITDDDFRELLKIHRKRRKFQKEYHSDILNSQYTYYGSGLISIQDRFPEHQATVKKDLFK